MCFLFGITPEMLALLENYRGKRITQFHNASPVAGKVAVIPVAGGKLMRYTVIGTRCTIVVL